MISKLSSKGQVTVPAVVRKALGLSVGDHVAYEIIDNAAIVRRVEPFDAAFHRSLARTLDEWNTPEDEDAFRDI